MFHISNNSIANKAVKWRLKISILRTVFVNSLSAILQRVTHFALSPYPRTPQKSVRDLDLIFSSVREHLFLGIKRPQSVQQEYPTDLTLYTHFYAQTTTETHSHSLMHTPGLPQTQQKYKQHNTTTQPHNESLCCDSFPWFLFRSWHSAQRDLDSIPMSPQRSPHYKSNSYSYLYSYDCVPLSLPLSLSVCLRPGASGSLLCLCCC